MRRYLCFRYPHLRLNRGVRFVDAVFETSSKKEIAEVEGSSSFIHGAIVLDQSSVSVPEAVESRDAGMRALELAGMSKATLKAMADERGISYTSRTNKEQLVAALSIEE